MTCNDVQLNYLPLFHSYSLVWVVLQNFVTGARQVIMNRFDPTEALQLIGEESVTMLHGFEANYGELLSAYVGNEDRYDLSSLRIGTHGVNSESGRLMMKKVQDLFCRTISNYGLTETYSGGTCGHPKDLTIEQSYNSTGYPLPGAEFRIVDPSTMADLERGAPGEILVKIYSLTLGYYKAEAETRKVIDEDGWFHTGDIGYFRPDGRLNLVGRYKDMIKVGGENVDPTEVETLLIELEAIDQVTVVACPDQRLGEIVAAFIVARDGFDPHLVKSEIDVKFKGRVASFKAPKRIEFIDEMPLTGTGKIDRLALRKRLEA
jgi:fatty-acyl-CoA synthase